VFVCVDLCVCVCVYIYRYAHRWESNKGYDDLEVLRSLPLEAQVPHTCQKETFIHQKETYIHQKNPTWTTHMSTRDERFQGIHMYIQGTY